MSLPAREVRQLILGEEARHKVLEGSRKIYEAVASTYGPKANNVLLALPIGDPTLTRDGVTVAKRISSTNVGLEDRAEADAAAILRQASEKTNKTAGDGTTATIVLAYELLRLANQRVVSGENAMVLKREIEADALVVKDFLAKKSQSSGNHLLDVATVSSGDPNIGKLISDTLKEIGSEGGITIREQQYPVIEVEKVNGYYFDKGFAALNQQIEYEKPWIFVTSKSLSSNSDILPLLNIVAKSPDKRPLVIIGEVRGDAMNTLITNVIRGVLDGVVITPPAYGDEAKLFMEDIAIYTGALLFFPSDNSATLGHFGSAQRVQISSERAIIFDGDGDRKEIVNRAAQIKMNLDKETNPHQKDQLEQRFSKLTGKIALVNVGGSTMAEMEELKYRVEDAIEATKSSMIDGILPGGATSLLRASECKISPLFAQALQNTFKKLMENAAEPPEYRMKQVLESDWGYGFNLREITEEPVNLAESGIWDATRAIVQVVENAASAAGSLITVNTIVEVVDEAKTETE